MTYLLTLGWPWFAGACALGALVGFATTRTAKDAPFSGGWVVLLLVAALAAGVAVSSAGIMAGREAATFDIGLLAAFAYVVGVAAGSALKATAPATATRPRKPPVVVVRGAAPAPVAKPQAAAPPAVDAAARSTAQGAKGVGAVSRALPGAPPPVLAAPRGAADDLSRIKGLGPKSVEKLNALGVFHYDQIAAWNLDNAKWIGAAINAIGRVERDKWIQQARTLVDSRQEKEKAAR